MATPRAASASRAGWASSPCRPCGIPAEVWEKPNTNCETPCGKTGSDDFTGTLGLQWQFMGSWRPDFFKCGDGQLRLYARALPEGGTTLWQCPQALTPKIACPAFFAETTVNVLWLKNGEQAGIGLVGGQYAYVALRRNAEGLSLVYVTSDSKEHIETVCDEVHHLPHQPITFRMTLLPTGYAEAVAAFEYGIDGVFHSIGQPFAPARHTWVGARLALFAMPLAGGPDQGGCAVFGPVTVKAVKTL